jgi:ketosteroid isomerase-like protein
MCADSGTGTLLVPNERGPPACDTARAMSHENVEIVKQAIAAYNRRDLDAIRALNHPDVELDWSASRGLEAGVYQGEEEVLRFYQNFLEIFEVNFEPDRFIESGDSVVVPNSAQVRGRDGIETVARSALVFEIRNGRVARLCLFQETREALEAVGLSE